MFDKPEDARMSKEASEAYGRKINKRNAQLENVEILAEDTKPLPSDIPPPLTEDEIRARVGNQNFENAKDSNTFGSVNS